jgi:hypothetical protein
MAKAYREIVAEGGGEIGAHLHPWNTPPLREEFTEANTMLKNLPPELQRAMREKLPNAFSIVALGDLKTFDPLP